MQRSDREANNFGTLALATIPRIIQQFLLNNFNLVRAMGPGNLSVSGLKYTGTL